MAYPTTPKPSNVEITPRWNTVISQFDSGKEQRRSKQTQDLYDIKLTYPPMIMSDFTTLWAYYQARKGRCESFYFYDMEESRTTHTAVYVALGDASTLIFDIPGKSTSAQSIYLNSVVQTLTTDYTILTGGGTDSADRVSFVSAPGAGVIITATFTGDMRIKCRFKEDKLTREALTYRLYKAGLELEGVAS
jgi:hypothetical protein